MLQLNVPSLYMDSSVKLGWAFGIEQCYNIILGNLSFFWHIESFEYIRTQKMSHEYQGLVCETQTCEYLRVVIYMNSCTNEGTTRSKTHTKMVLVGQSKHETILEEKEDIHITGYKKYKVQKLSNKRASHNHYWIV